MRTADVVDARVDAGVGHVLLHRPEKRNALNSELLRRLVELLDGWRDDDTVTAVVVSGGPRFFSAGLDLQEMAGFAVEEQQACASG